jgi:hypothetical protein
VPLIAWPRPTAAQPIRVGLAEFAAPLPDRLVGEDDAALGQERVWCEYLIRPLTLALEHRKCQHAVTDGVFTPYKANEEHERKKRKKHH